MICTFIFSDLPRAVWIAMFICTFIYVLTNAAYFSMITPEEMVASDAVALVCVLRMICTGTCNLVSRLVRKENTDMTTSHTAL